MDASNDKATPEDSNIKRHINILLPALTYMYPKNSSGTRHHLIDLFSKVFKDYPLTVLPLDKIRGIFFKSIVNFFKIASNSLNVAMQGYSVISTFMAMYTKRNIKIIVHTWKVPGYSDDKLTAKIYDYFLKKIIQKSVLTIVASKKQERQVKTNFPQIPVFFAPVTVDCEFWNPKFKQVELLDKFNLKKNKFIITVGGNDRNEEVGLTLAEKLDVQYVRITRNKKIIELVREPEQKLGMPGRAIILDDVSDLELISLYRYADVILLPTVTETNPAGLSSLVEGMACKGVVCAPAALAETYIVDNENGLLLDDYNTDKISERINGLCEEKRLIIKENARKFAIESLNSELVANNLRKVLNKLEAI